MNWMVPALSAGGGRVRHAHHGGEATGGGGTAAGRDGFLVGLAGFAEVNVDIDQAWAGDKAAGVDLARPLAGGGREGCNDAATLDEQIADGVATVRGIDDAGLLDPESRHGAEGEEA